MKIAGSFAQNASFSVSTCSFASLWFSCGVAVSMGEAAKPLLFECFHAGCHVVLRGRRGTLWHSNLFENVSKMSKLEELSHEMLVFLHPRVSSRVSGFPVASPCLWGKLQNFSFSKVSKQVVTSFCVAGVALCDIPTCLITCRKYSKMSKLEELSHEMLVFPAPTCPVSSLWFSCGFAVSMGEAPHSTLYTLHSTLHNLHFRLHTLHFTLHTLHFALYTPHSSLETLHSTLHTIHSTLPTLHFTLYTPHSTLDILHSRLYTLHSSLHTLHSTLLTLHSTLLTFHSTLHTSHFTLRTPHSTLSTPHSTLHTLHSTFHTPQFTL